MGSGLLRDGCTKVVRKWFVRAAVCSCCSPQMWPRVLWVCPAVLPCLLVRGLGPRLCNLRTCGVLPCFNLRAAPAYCGACVGYFLIPRLGVVWPLFGVGRLSLFSGRLGLVLGLLGFSGGFLVAAGSLSFVDDSSCMVFVLRVMWVARSRLRVLACVFGCCVADGCLKSKRACGVSTLRSFCVI